MADSKIDFYAWIDLETTGLDTTGKDFILEFAMILTYADLTPVYPAPYMTVVKHNSLEWLERLTEVPFVQDMHTKNGLINEVLLQSGKTVEEIETEVLDLLTPISEASTVMMAGASIGSLDLPMVQRWMPRLGAHLHYGAMDISPIRRFVKYTCGRPDLVPEEKHESNHRAFSDIKESLRQAHIFKDLFDQFIEQKVLDAMEEEG